MKRLSWMLSFVIVILAMPLSAFAADNQGEPQQRVEIREVRVEGGGGGQHEGRRQRRDEARGGNQQGQGWGGKWHGAGEDGEHMLPRLNWQQMPMQAEGMMRGIHERAMRINFHPDVKQSAIAMGMNNKAIQAETINININIGDVNIAGNEVSGQDSGELLEMIMEMMMKSHGQNGMGGGPDMGMQGGHPGPGNNGPGPWHERFDGSRPPHPDMPPHEMGNAEWHGDFMRWHDEVMRDPAAHEFMDEGWHQRMLEMHEQGMGSDGDEHELFQRWHEEMMRSPHADEVRNSDWHRRMLEMHQQDMGGHGDPHAGMHGNEFFGEMMRGHGTAGIRSEHGLHSAEFLGRGDDGQLRRYEVLIETGEDPVEPGDVRSPYHDFYFGNGSLPEHDVVIIDEQDFHDGPGMHPESAQRYFSELHSAGQDRFLFLPGQAHASYFGGQHIRPEIMELVAEIPDEVPVEFVEMIFRLGELAWEDEALRERLHMLMAAEYQTGDIEYQQMLRAYLQMLLDGAAGQG